MSSELVEKYVESLVNYNTKRNAENILKKFYEFLKLRNRKTLHTKPRDIDDFIAYFKADYRERNNNIEIEAGTVGQYISVISAFFNFLVSREYMSKSPILKDMAKPYYKRARNKRIESLSEEECTKLLTAADNPRDKAIIYTALSTGARNSEMRNIDTCDVDFQENIIHIRNGKGGKDRDVYFSDTCSKALKDWLQVRKYNNPDCDALFVTCNGHRMVDTTLDRVFWNNGAKAGIVVKNGKRNRVYPHLMRHSHATQYLKNGGNLVALQEQLGHDSLDTTKKYIHLNAKFRKEDYLKTMRF